MEIDVLKATIVAGEESAEIKIPAEEWGFLDGCSSVKLNSIDLIFKKDMFGYLESKLNIGLKANFDFLSMFSLGADNKWPKSNVITISVDPSVVFVKLLISENASVEFVNNDIEKFVGITKRLNKDICYLRSFKVQNYLKELREKYIELPEVKNLLEKFMEG